MKLHFECRCVGHLQLPGCTEEALGHEHLSAGWEYTNTLPRSCIRVRLACAWPILIGIRTLTQLRSRNVLDHTQRIKVTRPEVRSILLRTIFLYPFPSRWRQLFATANTR